VKGAGPIRWSPSSVNSSTTTGDDDLAPRSAGFRAILCGATVLMVGLSWPLWLDRDDFPRIPFVGGWDGLPAWLTRVLLGAIGATLVSAAIGWAWRPMMLLSLGLLTIEVLEDQNRLQPWVYQYLLIGLGLVAFPIGTSLRLARLYAISLYFYSGLSKLDASFVRELGPTFLTAGLSPLGLSAEGWPAAARTVAILAMPASEIAIAIGLVFRSTRGVALIGAVGLHSALLFILGPWNLGHSPNVLVWNGAMIVEALLLFWPSTSTFEGEARLGPVAWLMASFFFLFPLGERFGLSDSWPSHALYASHCERAEVYLLEDDLDRFPEAVRRRISEEGEGPWHRLDLTGWSRDVRGTPVYPQGRVGLGMAEFLADCPVGPNPVRVLLWSRADPWDGHRDRVECLGLRAIRRRGDRYLINAHPSGVVRP
jgi:hypothetical protein